MSGDFDLFILGHFCPRVNCDYFHAFSTVGEPTNSADLSGSLCLKIEVYYFHMISVSDCQRPAIG